MNQNITKDEEFRKSTRQNWQLISQGRDAFRAEPRSAEPSPVARLWRRKGLHANALADGGLVLIDCLPRLHKTILGIKKVASRQPCHIPNAHIVLISTASECHAIIVPPQATHLLNVALMFGSNALVASVVLVYYGALRTKRQQNESPKPRNRRVLPVCPLSTWMGRIASASEIWTALLLAATARKCVSAWGRHGSKLRMHPHKVFHAGKLQEFIKKFIVEPAQSPSLIARMIFSLQVMRFR